MLWRHSVPVLLKLNCKYTKRWLESKSQLDMNFNMKNMNMIINIIIEMLRSQNYRCRFSVPVLYIFNSHDLKVSLIHQVCWNITREHCLQTFPVQIPSEAWLGLGSQHHYKAPNDLPAKNVKRQWLTLGELAVLLIMDAHQQLLIVWGRRSTGNYKNDRPLFTNTQTKNRF